MNIDDRTEWLEADGLGGFASGTVSGVRTRRYHALLLPATTPPTGRMALVNGFDAWVETPTGAVALTSQRYAPDVVDTDGASRIAAFDHEPWPTWQFALPHGIAVTQEIFIDREGAATAIAWTLAEGEGDIELNVRPFLSGRDYHSTHHENGAFRFEPTEADASVAFRPYDNVPSVVTLSNGRYRHAPEWYRNFLYLAEQQRGLDAVEDLAAPGVFSWRLRRGMRAVLMLTTGEGVPCNAADVDRRYQEARASELRRRKSLPTPLDRAADAYLVRRGSGRTIVAGYPWFTDWGRDTFIHHGLCIATGRLAEARGILVEWASAVSQGMPRTAFRPW